MIFTARTSIAVFGLDGGVVRRFGRPGRGPAELESISKIDVIGDTVWVMDGRLRRFVRFDTSGMYLGTVAVAAPGSATQVVGVASNTEYWAARTIHAQARVKKSGLDRAMPLDPMRSSPFRSSEHLPTPDEIELALWSPPNTHGKANHAENAESAENAEQNLPPPRTAEWSRTG